MKIAVTYDNGNVFQYFGHTKKIIIYSIENGKVARTDKGKEETIHWLKELGY